MTNNPTPMTNKQAPDRQTLCADPECTWSIPHVQGRSGCKWAAPDDSGDFVGCYWEPGDEGVKALVKGVTPEFIERMRHFGGSFDAVTVEAPAWLLRVGADYLTELPRLQSDNARLRESNRLMGDVIDYACRHIGGAAVAMEFIEAYREDRWANDADFVRYRKMQARAALTLSEGDGE